MKSRWTTDPGAIPGEPFDYLDIAIGEKGEIGEARAVIVEIETPGGSLEKREHSVAGLSDFSKSQSRLGRLQRYTLTRRLVTIASAEAISYDYPLA
jgi:hypothetical protein